MIKLVRPFLTLHRLASSRFYHYEKKASRFTISRRMAEDNQIQISQNIGQVQLPDFGSERIKRSDAPAQPLQGIASQILKEKWSFQPPFGLRAELLVPIYNFQDGEYSGQNIMLRGDIFNLPMRRDIIHNVHNYFKMHDYRITKRVNGKKPAQQKGRGMARQGNLRATGRKKGGKPHGPVPRQMMYPINKKVKWMALKSMLSARLYEGNLFIINSEDLDSPTPEKIEQIFEPYKRENLLIVTGLETDLDFYEAAESLPNLLHLSAIYVTTEDVLNSSKVLITKEGLRTLELIVDCQQKNYFRNRSTTREELPTDVLFQKKKQSYAEMVKQEFDYSQSKDLEILSQSLKHYVETELSGEKATEEEEEENEEEVEEKIEKQI